MSEPTRSNSNDAEGISVAAVSIPVLVTLNTEGEVQLVEPAKSKESHPVDKATMEHFDGHVFKIDGKECTGQKGFEMPHKIAQSQKR
jgi:hypothetical protein